MNVESQDDGYYLGIRRSDEMIKSCWRADLIARFTDAKNMLSFEDRIMLDYLH